MQQHVNDDEILGSPVSTSLFLVVDRGSAHDAPSIDGVAMVAASRNPCSAVCEASGSTLRGGQLYVDDETGLAMLCIRPGTGSLSYQGRTLSPSSVRRLRTTPWRRPNSDE